MQTFLADPDYRECARVLDQKRLGKQRVETLQIMQALAQLRLKNTHVMVDTGRVRTVRKVDKLGVETVEQKPVLKRVDLPRSQWQVVDEKVGWDTHAVTRMWRGAELSLLLYQFAVCQDWVSRGYRDTCSDKTAVVYARMARRDSADVLEQLVGEDPHGLDDLELVRRVLEEVHRGHADVTPPTWANDERVYTSHRAALLHKKFEWYSQFGWDEEPLYQYFWPEGTS